MSCMRSPACAAGLPGETSEIIAPQSCEGQPARERRRDRLQQDADFAAMQMTVPPQLRIRHLTSALGMANPRP